MRPAAAWLACLVLATATPALAQPVVITGDPPARPAAAPECTVEATGASATRIRCRSRDATEAAGSEMSFLVSAQPAGPQRCPGADVVRLTDASPQAPAATMVVEGAPARPCA